MRGGVGKRSDVICHCQSCQIQIFTLRRRFDLFRQVEDLTRRLRDVATMRFQAGEVSKLEINLAEIQLGQARKDTLTAERNYQNTLHELERLLR